MLQASKSDEVWTLDLKVLSQGVETSNCSAAPHPRNRERLRTFPSRGRLLNCIFRQSYLKHHILRFRGVEDCTVQYDSIQGVQYDCIQFCDKIKA